MTARNDASRVDPVPAVDQRPQGAPSRSIPDSPSPLTAPPAVPQPTPAALAALDPGVSFLEMIREYAGALQREPGSMHHIESLNRVLEYVDGLHTQLAAARRGAGDTDYAHSLREAAGCAFDAINISGASEETAREASNILGPALTAYDHAARAAHPEEPQHG